MTNAGFEELFGGPARKPESRITRREMDLAASVQHVLEEAVLALAQHARDLTGMRHLVLAGGVALNCVANGRLLRSGTFDDLWIQPAAGDAGGALGAALLASHAYFDVPRRRNPTGRDAQRGSYLGPRFPSDEVQAFLIAARPAAREGRGRESWPRVWRRRSRRARSSGSSTAAWSSGRARSARDRSSAIRAAPRCSPS